MGYKMGPVASTEVPAIGRRVLGEAVHQFATSGTPVEGAFVSWVRTSRHAPEGKGTQGLVVMAPDTIDAVELLDEVERVITAFLAHQAAWDALQSEISHAQTNY